MHRIPIATIIGLTSFVAYLVTAVTLFDYVAPFNAAWQALYFVIAGTIWTWPARQLMYWAAHKL